ncbi:MAG: DUF3667 domain-containing protein [Flavobacterium sp.]|nr:DUF3667 domain-containing protein [Flavobacterium sp.]
MPCKNCQSEMLVNDAFCSTCGAKVIANRITIKQIVSDLSLTYFSFDNKFFVTFKAIFADPSDVVNGYINGLRMRYVNPISYFIIAVAMGGFFSLLMVRGHLVEIDYAQFSDPNSPIKMEEIMRKVADYNNLVYLISLPFMALMSKIVFYNLKQYNYAEHLVIYGYTYSQCAILSFLFIPVLYVVKPPMNYYSVFSIVLYTILHVYFLKKIFNLTPRQMFLKTLLFIPVFLVFYIGISIVTAIAIFVYLFLTNQFPIP